MLKRCSLLFALCALAAACSPEQDSLAPEALLAPEAAAAPEAPEAPEAGEHADPVGVGLDHDHPHSLVLPDRMAVEAAMAAGTLALEQPDAFRQVGFLVDADALDAMQWRAPQSRAHRSWQPVEITWREDRQHVARIFLDEPVTLLEVRGATGLSYALVEFYPEIVASRAPQGPAPMHSPPPALDPVQTVARQQAVAPRELVIPRSEWGAREPNRVCGDIVAPYRMSVHHTAVPSGDEGNAPARVRGIQAFHMDSRGWCDIGYHFLVSQSGNIYQGRSDERRPGAHVGDQNNGNIGISFIADFTAQYPTEIQLNAGASILGWIARTYNIPIQRDKVKGHREWPGQTTTCPGGNLMAVFDNLLTRAGSQSPNTPTPPASGNVTLSVRFIGLPNFYTQVPGQNFGDSLVGERLRAEIVLKNASTSVLRGVKVGFQFESPYLKPLNYAIFSDYPAKDGATWQLNDANDVPTNPPKENMGSQGFLTMNAFSAGESKRVLIDLEASRYSIGFVDRPDVRAWVRNIDGLYATAETFAETPATNALGQVLKGFDQLDILARHEWQFNGTHVQELEGWEMPSGSTGEVRIDTQAKALAMDGASATSILQSPVWTRIEARNFDQLVMRVRSQGGRHRHALFWKRDGENFSEERVARFVSEGNGQSETVVVPLGQARNWGGSVTRLRLMPVDAPAGATRNVQIDALYFQSSATRQTSSATEPFVAQRPAVLLGLNESVDGLDVTPSPGGSGTGGTTTPGTPTGPGQGGSSPTTGGALGTGGPINPAAADNELVDVHAGCQAVPGQPAAPAMAPWALVAGAFAWSRRRLRQRRQAHGA